MVFEKIMQPPFTRSRQRRLILARLFKAGTISASVRESRQRRLILQIGVNRRCRDLRLCDRSPGFEKPG